MKSRYGVTPWGSWFIEVLDSYQMGSRLDRGRTYANTGRVLSLSLEAGRALAKIKGNFRPFYRVEIDFPPLKNKELVYRMIEEDPPLLARIAAGELPEAFLKKLRNKGINLIPRRWREMKRFCSCPDDGDPCKHMAALYYIIAREIDADPHLLFRLRGMDLAERFGKAAVRTIALPFSVTAAEAGINLGAKAEPLELDEIPHCADLITSLLPPSPAFCEKDFSVQMAEFYHNCAHYRAWESAEAETNAEMEHHFSRSQWTVICPDPGPAVKVFLDSKDINGNVKRCTLYEAFEYFVNFSSEDGTASYGFLFYLFKFLNMICSSGAFIPYVYSQNGTLRIIWRPFESLPPVLNTLNAVASHECGMLNVTGNRKKSKEETGAGIKASGRSVVDLLASAFLNEWVHRRLSSFGSSFNKGGKSSEYRELFDLFFASEPVDVSAPAKRSLPQAIDRWLSVLHINFSSYSYSLTVKEAKRVRRKEPNAQPEDDTGDFYFSLSMEVLNEEGTQRIPLSKIRDLEILRAPIALSNYLVEIHQLLSRLLVRISEARLVEFLDSAAPLLNRLGMAVNLPKSLHRELKPRLLVRGSSASSLTHFLDFNTLSEFQWQVAIGTEILSLEEFRKLVNEKRALVRFRDGFVKINTEEFSRLLKKAGSSVPDFNDFLKAHFSGNTVLAFDSREVIDNLFREQDLPVPESLNAELRPYQKRGYNWVCSLLLSGFGCILADDMGLGKTVQSIAVLLRLKEEGLLGSGCFVVAPAALLNNWEKELSRFAPSLSVSRYHGLNRILNRKFDVFLTTYQTAVRDSAKLKDTNFSLLLVDEAHLMKNAETRISKTIKLLRSKYRLALSGTPVENRLEDLRSLFDFILPGYLGSAPEFRELYRVPIEVMRNRERAETLRKITSPFLLRRLKTDRTIITDLPDKIVANEYAVLEKGQAVLYETVVSETLKKSERIDPKERSALILSLLTSLKQICDHPRVYDKESPALSELSGKAQLLVTLLEGILANREKTLVFSQYVETLDCLQQIIKAELDEAPLVYHGGLSQNVRAGIIDRFQNDPASRILLVSLKAGGLGLNLTAANRVIHYDLWYNPAVENQATDRVFRIGQKRTVFVHRFITKNSFEEKIDAMISSKQELVDMTIASGESWLARMSHEELKTLFDR